MKSISRKLDKIENEIDLKLSDSEEVKHIRKRAKEIEEYLFGDKEIEAKPYIEPSKEELEKMTPIEREFEAMFKEMYSKKENQDKEKQKGE